MKKDIQHILDVARETCRQISRLTPMNVLMSWGVDTLRATTFRDMPALRIKVNGRLWSEYVIIALDEGKDYYEVWLADRKGNSKKVADEIDFTQLSDCIDTAIEKGTDEDEYFRFCEAERAKLMNGMLN